MHERIVSMTATGSWLALTAFFAMLIVAPSATAQSQQTIPDEPWKKPVAETQAEMQQPAFNTEDVIELAVKMLVDNREGLCGDKSGRITPEDPFDKQCAARLLAFDRDIMASETYSRCLYFFSSPGKGWLALDAMNKLLHPKERHMPDDASKMLSERLQEFYKDADASTRYGDCSRRQIDVITNVTQEAYAKAKPIVLAHAAAAEVTNAQAEEHARQQEIRNQEGRNAAEKARKARAEETTPSEKIARLTQKCISYKEQYDRLEAMTKGRGLSVSEIVAKQYLERDAGIIGCGRLGEAW